MSLKPKRVNFTATWSALEETVRGVITLGDVPRAIWNDRFSDVYSLCVAYPEPLADRLYQETKNFLNNHVKQLYEKVIAQGRQENIGLLKAYFNAWVEYSQGIIYLHRLYLYLNQQHIKKQKLSEAELTLGNFSSESCEQMEIGELGLEIWKEHMIEPMKTELVRLLLENIEDDRNGKPTVNTTEVIRDIIQSFVQVQFHHEQKSLAFEVYYGNMQSGSGTNQYYQRIFEEPFLKATGEFYKREAAKLLQECTISEYLEKVQQKLSEEAARVRKFVHVTSYAKIRSECELHFVADHLPVLHAECVPMIKEEKKSDLKNIYSLLKGVPNGLPYFVDQFQQHIKDEGLSAISNLQGDNIHITFVDNMLNVHKKYRDLIDEVFGNDKALVGALDKACAQIINQRPTSKTLSRSPELLAKYCDTLLKRSSKGLTDTEIEDKLTKSITIFKYVDDKDVYQKFYAKMLARRLIHQQSHSMDAEEGMINRLKQACGYEFTNKLHRMYTDISLSADLNIKFQEYLKRSKTDLGINFSINVLQAGAWPLGQVLPTFNLPQELEKSVQVFEEFYKTSFNGRKLSWYHHLCQGEIKLTYLKKPYIISMQTFQMAILLLFEKADGLTGREIQEMIQLNEDQLLKQIQSLVDSKLLKDGGVAERTLETTYYLNFDYSNKRTRLKISGALQKETPQEVETTFHRVEEDRKLYLQAAIVRIMKSRKVLKHNRLVQEVLAQSGTTFQLSVSMIKKCIEALIDKQYIERTANSQDVYSYIA